MSAALCSLWIALRFVWMTFWKRLEDRLQVFSERHFRHFLGRVRVPNFPLAPLPLLERQDIRHKCVPSLGGKRWLCYAQSTTLQPHPQSFVKRRAEQGKPPCPPTLSPGSGPEPP